jgi:dTDP-glucose 4,6-dehydratase
MPSHLSYSSQSFQEIFDRDFERLKPHFEGIDFAHKTLLISGATGFFGAWLLGLCSFVHQNLKPDGFRVMAISRHPAQFLKRHGWASGAAWLEWIEGDIRSFEIPAGNLDWVIHAATETSAEAANDPALLFETIVAGTKRMLDCASQCQASRILLVSSGAVYGTQSPDISHQSEDSPAACSPLASASSYAEGKRLMELLGARHADATGAAVMSARCFAFVGAGLPLDAHFAIGNFIRDALERPQLSIGGDGLGRRSYLYAADLAIWLFRILVAGENKRAYNVGSDQDLSIAELAQRVAAALAPSKPVVIENRFTASPPGNRYVPSIARARSELGLDVWTALPDAVTSTAIWQHTKA